MQIYYGHVFPGIGYITYPGEQPHGLETKRLSLLLTAFYTTT